jgi:hypothetical protein
MAKVVERTEARYDAQEVAFGTVYKWRPESVLIECECGETVTLTAPEAACEECGAEHTGLLKQDSTESHLRGDEETHPWRYYSVKSDSGTSLPY